MVVPFVGREAELAALGSIARRAQQDQRPTAALIVGEPGSGKSTLLAEVLARTIRLETIRVVGYEPMRSVPLATAGDLLRRLATAPRDGAVLHELVFGGPGGQDRDPLRIFEAAHRALVSEGPVVIAIDDLQWVDARSVALIHYLLRAASATGKPLSVIAAARPSPEAATFRTTVEVDLAADRRRFIDLGPLSLAEGRSLVRAIDGSLDDASAADLVRRAGGSPFWLDALARRRGSTDPASLVGERLRDLTLDAGSLLAALAVGARPFAEDEIAGLLDWTVERVRQSTHELLARGLAVAIGGATRVAHDLIREAAVASLSATARRRLHARLATWIESEAGDDLALLREALAHRGEAGLPATELAGRLLTSAQRRLLRADDLRLLASIADALDPTDPTRGRLDRSLGELAAVLGEQELALDRWTRVSESARDGSGRRHAEWQAALAAYRLGRSGDAHRHLDRARAAGGSGEAVAVQLDALQAEVELWLDHETAAGSRSAAMALERVHRLATEVGGIGQLDPEGRRAYLAALVVAGDAALQEDRADEVIDLSETILEVAAGLDEESHVAALIRTGFALRPLGRTEESEAQYRKAWEISKRQVLPTQTVEAGHGLARGLRDLGRLVEAREIAIETSRLEVRIGNAPRRWGSAASIAHMIDLLLGETSTALRALRDDAATEPDPHYRLAIREAVASWQARSVGSRAAAEVGATLAMAEADSALARCPRCAAELSIISAELLARVGRVADARRTLAAWDAQTTRHHPQRDLWRTRATVALAIADGDTTLALALLEPYVAALTRAGPTEDLLWAKIDMGRVLAPIDRARAIAVLTDASELASHTGASGHGRLVAQALRTLGVRAWRRGRPASGAGISVLSERETTIADLVADGMSNREIAETLRISPKTVERHVTNALAKLGLRNRTEMASLVRSTPVRGYPDE